MFSTISVQSNLLLVKSIVGRVLIANWLGWVGSDILLQWRKKIVGGVAKKGIMDIMISGIIEKYY